MKTVNEQGLKVIANYLFNLHNKKSFSDTELSYFVADIEDALGESGEAQFVIAAKDSQSGHDELCLLSDECFDVEEYDASLIEYHRYKQMHDCKCSGCTVCVAFEH